MSTVLHERTWTNGIAEDTRPCRLCIAGTIAGVLLVHLGIFAVLLYKADHVRTLPEPSASRPVTIEFAAPMPRPQVNPVAIPAPAPTPLPKPQPAPKPKPKAAAPKAVVPASAQPSTPVSSPPASTSSMPVAQEAKTSSSSGSAPVSEPAPAIPATTGRFTAQNPAPTYPMQARRRRLEGKVVLSVQVDAQGQPQVVNVQRSSGHDALDAAAVEAVRRWRFEPASRNGQAESSWKTLPVDFKLNG